MQKKKKHSFSIVEQNFSFSLFIYLFFIVSIKRNSFKRVSKQSNFDPVK